MNKPTLTALLISTALLSACDSDKIKKNINDATAETIDPTVLNSPLINSEFIDAKIATLLSDYEIPGMTVAVVSGSDTLHTWTKAYGVANIDTQNAVTTDTAFWLGSLSKHVTGLSIMIARDQGLLDLDDDIRPLIASQSEFTIDNPAEASITWRHLMSHSSGIIDSDAYECAYFVNTEDGEQALLLNIFEDEEICDEDGPTTLQGYLSSYLDEDGRYYSEEDNFSEDAPGTEYQYSNIATGLAGYAFELATGQTLETFAQQHIFAPLSMGNTSWDISTLETSSIATPYSYDDDDEELLELPRYELATWPDGGLRSSITDVTRLMTTLMQNGQIIDNGGQLLERATLAEMQTPTSDEYALFTEVQEGLRYGNATHTITGHSGSDPGAFSYMFFNENKDNGVTIISNGDDEAVDEDSLNDALVDLLSTLFEAGDLMKD